MKVFWLGAGGVSMVGTLTVAYLSPGPHERAGLANLQAPLAPAPASLARVALILRPLRLLLLDVFFSFFFFFFIYLRFCSVCNVCFLVGLERQGSVPRR